MNCPMCGELWDERICKNCGWKEPDRCGGSGMVLYNPGPNQAGEMCSGCEDCEEK